MNLTIDYETAMRLHPEEAAEAIAKLRKSRSKHRKADPATRPWCYSWGVRASACSFADILSGASQARSKSRREMTLQERVDDAVARVVPSLCVNNYGVRLQTVPDLIRLQIEKGHREEMAEQARFAAMTQEEREAEAQKALDQLRGGSGFMEINL